VTTTGESSSSTHPLRKGRIEDLAREVVPALAGLSSQELERLGYVLIEDDTDRTLVFVQPGDLVQV
jgi:hypothetical protein